VYPQDLSKQKNAPLVLKEKNSWLLGKMFESGFPDASGREEG
jgi:hypothetical protein